jgi:hypothetical protein
MEATTHARTIYVAYKLIQYAKLRTASARGLVGGKD